MYSTLMPTEQEEQPDIKKLSVVTLIAVVVLGAVVYGAYLYSQKKAGNIALPGGTTYLGQPSPTPGAQVVAPQKFSADPSAQWVTFTGKKFPYSFSHPSTLDIVVFPNDKLDAAAINWNNISPQVNILASIEDIQAEHPKDVKLTKLEYVKNWYKYFGGLKGVQSVTQFTNTGGLSGYKAIYINSAGTTPNVDVFFELPGRPTLLLHLANGVLEPTLFDRIVDSVKWNAPKPKPTAAS